MLTRKNYFFITCLLCISALGLMGLSCSKKKEKRYLIGVSQCSDDEWRDKLNKEISLEAMFRGNIDVLFRSANDNNAKQAEDILYFMKKKVDLMIISPNESAPVTPAVEMAYKSNIPVIISDRKIYSDKYTAFVGPDNYEIGVLAGEFIAKYLKGRGKIVEIKGTEGASPTIERHEGFMSVISKYKDIEIVYQASGIYLESIGEKKMEEALSLNPEIDLVFAHNDRMAKGAYKAVKAAGREKEIPFVGIDALAEEGYGVDMILQDILVASFVNPTGGDKIMELAMNILQNKPFERESILPTTQVDKTNAKTLKLQSEYSVGQNEKIISLNKEINKNIALYIRQKTFLYCSVIILILLLLLLYLLMKAFRMKNQSNQKLSEINRGIEDKNKQLESQRDQLIELTKQLEEATQSKLLFYTNISHDFLTPITLIIEPIEQLLQDPQITQSQYDLLVMVKRNVSIIHRLVKQILDFRKYENGQLNLNLSKSNLKDCIEEWCNAFYPSIKRKNIKFNLHVDGDEKLYDMHLDYNKIERLFYNLLSNALKFTNQGGSIHVDLLTECQETKDFAVIRIFDNGIGIDKEYIENIFNHFFKVDNHSSGSGIGLALAKAFADLHGGDIRVKSELGKGTEFSVFLPYIHTNMDDGIYSLEMTENDDTNSDGISLDYQIVSFSEKNKPVILIVDDNRDILDYLCNLLQTKYAILLANNGQNGLKLAARYLPDIVISDVMMPVMDGFELCQRLKSESITNHIPIILLTALTLDDQKIKGFNSGADAYFEKPFNSSLLLASIENMIKGRKSLKSTFSEFDMVQKEERMTEQLFLEKIYVLLDKNISDFQFKVEDIGKSIGLSRVQLYRKIKDATGYSPNELLRIYRLRKAKKLLSTTDRGIAEIAYEVGFSSPSYFTKCFREYYKESPTFFLKRMTPKDKDIRSL